MLFGGSEILNILCCFGDQKFWILSCVIGGSEILNLLCCLGDQKFWILSCVILGDQKVWILSCVLGGSEVLNPLLCCFGDQKFWIVSCVIWGIRNSGSSPVLFGDQKFWISLLCFGGIRNSKSSPALFGRSEILNTLLRSYNPFFKRVGSFHCTLHQSREQEIQLIVHQFCFCTTADMEHCSARKNVQNPSPKNLEESLNSPGGNPCKIQNLFSPATRDLFEIRILLWRVSINWHYHFVWTPFSCKN